MPSFTTAIALYLVLKRFNLRKVGLISGVVFLIITQWIQIPALWQSSEQLIQRGLVIEASTRAFSSIKHEIIGEEIINDPNNPKYKLLRIKVKLTIPESGSYSILPELDDKTGNKVAVQSYVNGKSLVFTAQNIELSAGENLIAFDFPYVYFNKDQKREVINLPYNDSAIGTYGPFKFSLRLFPSNRRDLIDKAALSSSDMSKLEYTPPVEMTKNTYNYLDFYQR